MRNLKLNSIVNEKLSKGEMNSVFGGQQGPGTKILVCGCGCIWANNGGSSTTDNGNANSAIGTHSTGLPREKQTDHITIVQK